jgi:hypothetical protein
LKERPALLRFEEVLVVVVAVVVGLIGMGLVDELEAEVDVEAIVEDRRSGMDDEGDDELGIGISIEGRAEAGMGFGSFIGFGGGCIPSLNEFDLPFLVNFFGLDRNDVAEHASASETVAVTCCL